MKEELINNGKFSYYVAQRKINFKIGLDCESSGNYINLSEEEVKECNKIYYNNHKRKQNGFDYVCDMAFIATHYKKDYYLYFLTLTFNNDAFNVSENTRHDAVKRFLNKNTEMYIANIDYGDLNEREHYHALVLSNKAPEGWKLGFMKAQKINIDKNTYCEDLKRIKNYLFKLNNHTYKVSTQLRRIMKDRNNSFIPKYLLKTLYKEEIRNFKLILKVS